MAVEITKEQIHKTLIAIESSARVLGSDAIADDIKELASKIAKDL